MDGFEGEGIKPLSRYAGNKYNPIFFLWCSVETTDSFNNLIKPIKREVLSWQIAIMNGLKLLSSKTI